MTEMNGKAMKFRKLAEKRVDRMLKIIKQIGALSTKTYESTPQQIEKIFNTLHAELDVAEKKFSPQPKEQQISFRLD